MTLLALLTLDSAKWETRGHAVPDTFPSVDGEEPVVVPMAEPVALSAARPARVLARSSRATGPEVPLLNRTRRVIKRRLVETRRQLSASESWPALTTAPRVSHGDRRK
jgi:hypothetical protein